MPLLSPPPLRLLAALASLWLSLALAPSRPRMPPLRLFPAVAVLLLVAAACAEPLEFAEWELPVPEGTPVHEYAFVFEDERSGTLGLERDLVLEEAFGTPLYQPRDVEIAADGRIFVLDAGNNRVVSFSADGEPLVAFGQAGQGPGEFQSARNLGILDGNVVVWESRNVRFSVYDMDGSHIVDHPREDRIYPTDLVDLEGQLWMINPDPAFILPGGVEAPPAIWRAGLYSLAGVTASVALEYSYPFGYYWEMDRSAGSIPIEMPLPASAIGYGIVYLSPATQYQVLAIEPDGAFRWALRSNFTAPLVSEEHKRAIVADLAERIEGLAYQHFHWPERYATVENLEIDGRGNIYVFPHAPRSRQADRENTDPVPVDVYDAEGARIFTGWSAIRTWDAAHGDAVYRIEDDPASGEQVVARYRVALTEG